MDIPQEELEWHDKLNSLISRMRMAAQTLLDEDIVSSAAHDVAACVEVLEEHMRTSPTPPYPPMSGSGQASLRTGNVPRETFQHNLREHGLPLAYGAPVASQGEDRKQHGIIFSPALFEILRQAQRRPAAARKTFPRGRYRGRMRRK